MAQILITKSKLDNLADAISEKSSATTPLTVDEMTAAVQSIVTGGGIETELDPVFSASPAAGITSTDITNWNTPEIYLVTISSSNSTYTADKTFTEITTAVNAGKFVYCKFSTGPIYFSLTSITSSAIIFTELNHTVTSSPTIKANGFKITSSNVITWVSVTLYTNKYLVTSINSSSTDSAFPSAKAVYTYVNTSVPTRYDSSTNTSGYLTMADLPIYDGTVE